MENENGIQQTPSAEPIKAATGQFVTFMIGDERFGVDILKVRDIIDMAEITRVPKSPRFLKGVINLRGNIVPVVDLRLKFSLPEIAYTGMTVIIVVEVRAKFIGMIVDSVSDVVDVAVSGIHDSPYFRTTIRDDFVDGVGKLDDELIIILDVDRILHADARCISDQPERQAQ